MLFKNIKELVDAAEGNYGSMSEVMIAQEMQYNEISRQDVLQLMNTQYQTMKAAVDRGMKGVQSRSGLSGRDARKLADYLAAGRFLTDETFVRSICYAVATNEVNASMGVVCATPTAGASGVLPAVIISAAEKLKLTDEQAVRGLFTAGAIGYIIANNATIAGASGGCQAEVGSASAMAAAAVTEMAGGTARQAANAAAIALKNMLGLTCDPVAGLVEVPCIKRNAAGASNAMAAAEMALAGIESRIPCDEVIQAMYHIGQAMPVTLKETALGGLAVTETGLAWKKKVGQK